MIAGGAAEKKSLDDFLDNSTEQNIELSIEEQRKNFKFPKDFSFENPEFEKEVIKLYGRHNFDWEKLGKEEKKRVRKDYRGKCRDYLIEHGKLPPGLAYLISGMAGLPNHTTHKKAPKKTLEFGINILAGSLSEKYADAIARLMNEKRHILTRDSIYFDAAEILFIGAIAGSFWAGTNSFEWLKDVHDWAEGAYAWTGLGKETLKWWMTGAAGFRTAEVIVRTALYKINKIHTPSPAMLFPINPSITRGGTMTLVFLYDVGERIKELYTNTKKAYKKYTSPKMMELAPEKEINESKYNKTLLEYTKPSGNAKAI